MNIIEDRNKLQETVKNYLLKLESKENDLPSKINIIFSENFDIKKVANSDTSYIKYQQILDNNLDLTKFNPDNFEDVYLSEITPQEYLDYSRVNISHSPSVSIKDYTNIDNPRWKVQAQGCREDLLKFKNNEKAPLLILDFKNLEQDGNHRAGAAYLAGIEKVCVLVCI